MTYEKTIEVLRAARALVARGWTQGALARGADGAVESRTSPRATCWCASGALVAAGSMARVLSGSAAVTAAYDAVARVASIRADQIAAWNDAVGRTQADVLSVFDRAIASLEAA